MKGPGGKAVVVLEAMLKQQRSENATLRRALRKTETARERQLQKALEGCTAKRVELGQALADEEKQLACVSSQLDAARIAGEAVTRRLVAAEEKIAALDTALEASKDARFAEQSAHERRARELTAATNCGGMCGACIACLRSLLDGEREENTRLQGEVTRLRGTLADCGVTSPETVVPVVRCPKGCGHNHFVETGECCATLFYGCPCRLPVTSDKHAYCKPACAAPGACMAGEGACGAPGCKSAAVQS